MEHFALRVYRFDDAVKRWGIRKELVSCPLCIGGLFEGDQLYL